MAPLRTFLAVVALLHAATGFADTAEDAAAGTPRFDRPIDRATDKVVAPVCFILGRLFDAPGTASDYEFESTFWYRMAAERGHVDAQVRVGDRYASGVGADIDRDEAARWWRKAGAAGQKDALEALVTYYRTSGDDESRIRWTRIAADAGIANAQFRMGWYYFKGDGVPRDQQEKIRWFKLAAEQGHASAQFNLGVTYAKGVDVTPPDYDLAYKWYLAAAKQGLGLAVENLSSLLGEREYGTPEQRRVAFETILNAAEDGSREAQFATGYMYSLGVGIEQSDVNAAQWMLRAAQAGHDVAQYNIGEFYDTGKGVEQEPEIATFWHAQSAAQGYADAQYRLANRFAFGYGAPTDPLAAFDWMLAAAEQDHIEAQFMLGQFYREGVGVESDEDQALYWYRRAADQGLADAMHNVGEILLVRSGRARNATRADYVVAFKWILLAADAGVPGARIHIGEFRDAIAAGKEPGLDLFLDHARYAADVWRDRFLARGGEISTLPAVRNLER